MPVKCNLWGILETFQDGVQDRWWPAKRKTSWPHLEISIPGLFDVFPHYCWSSKMKFVVFSNIGVLLLLCFDHFYCLEIRGGESSILSESLVFDGSLKTTPSEFTMFDSNNSYRFKRYGLIS